MRLGRGDILGRGIGADDIGSKSCQRLRQDPAAPADVEDSKLFQTVEPLGVAIKTATGVIADIGQPNRIEFMQGRHLTAWIPPFRGKRREPRNLGVIDARCLALALCSRHGSRPFNNPTVGPAGVGRDWRWRFNDAPLWMLAFWSRGAAPFP